MDLLSKEGKIMNMQEESEIHQNRKKPQFGDRYLTDPAKVFQHNAWDDVEWDDDLTKFAEEKIRFNSEFIVSSEDQEKFEVKANEFWDKFYNIHQNRFFKDRHWLFTEFPELCVKTYCKDANNSNEMSFSSKPDENCCEEISPLNSATNIWEVGCGAGNTVFPILEANLDSNVFVYCCDFSEVAVSLVKNHPDFAAERCHPFVCDISSDVWNIPFKENSLDFIILVFVLSAVHPEKMQEIVVKMASYLKPGGQILFRDYGRYDMVELRFKPGQCLSDHFYVRGDGTRVYFFSEDDVDKLFSSAELQKVQLFTSRRLQVNRGKQLKMYRIWIQAKYCKL